MKRVSAICAANILCAVWLAASVNGAAAASAETTATPLMSTADSAANFPGTLDGEIRRAQQLRASGNLDEAAHSLAQLMLVAPDDARVVGEYGKVLVEQGRAEGGEQFLTRAVALQASDWTLYSALGVAYDQLDQRDKARLAYEHALTLSPNNPAVLNNLAVSRMLAGDYAGAQRFLSQAQAQGTSNPKIVNNFEKLASLRGPAPATAPVAQVTTPVPVPVSQQHKVVSNGSLLPRAVEVRDAAPTKAVASSVVMQAVPIDPLEGPVNLKPAPVHHIASAAKAKRVAKATTPPPPPTLRTAAEVN